MTSPKSIWIKISNGSGGAASTSNPPGDLPGAQLAQSVVSRGTIASRRTQVRRQSMHQKMLLRLIGNSVLPNWQFPLGPDEMTGVAVRIPLEIILMLRLGLPKFTSRSDLGYYLARPQP